MANEIWYVLVLLLLFILTFACVRIFDSRRLSHNQRRLLAGINLLLMSGVCLHRLMTQTKPVLGALTFALLPGLSGLSLFAIVYQTKLQGSVSEYIACALGGGTALALLFAFNQSMWVQWGTALVGTLVGYGTQRAAGRPFTYGKDA